MAAFDRPLPHPSKLSDTQDSGLNAVITRLFEHSATLELLVKPLLREGVPTYDTFIEKLRLHLRSYIPDPATLQARRDAGQTQLLDDALNAHPRLGETKSNLSHASASEQANLQSTVDTAEAVELESLNAEYEKAFNLRYLVFVNGRRRLEIFADMRRRIRRGDAWMERIEAIDALCDIAKDRVSNIGVDDAL